MRSQFLAVLAVSSLALVGCSATTPAPAPETTAPAAPASATPTASATPKPSASVNPNAMVEKQFADFAEIRSHVHAAGVAPNKKATIKALHAFCEDGKPIKVSKVQPLNENLEIVAEKAYCDQLK